MKLAGRTAYCPKIVLCAAILAFARPALTQQIAGMRVSPVDTGPVTEKTLREYLETTHYIEDKKKQWRLKDTPEEQQLPLWYPLPVWKEFEAARQQIDIVAIALPIYQKKVSESLGRTMTRLSETPEGQLMGRQLLEDESAARAKGMNAQESYQSALEAQRIRSDAAYPHLLDSFAPTERRNLTVFLSSREIKQFALDRAAIGAQMQAALSVKQKELVHETTVRHKQELVAARRAYEAAHASTPAKKN